MDLSEFETDTSLSEEGVWIPLDDETRLRIARYGNKKFKALMQKKIAPYKRLLAAGRMDDDVAERVLAEALAEAVLVGWEKLMIDGKEVEYSTKAALEVLMDERFVDFREYVVSLAQDMEVYRTQEVNEAVGKVAEYIRWSVEWGAHVDFLESIADTTGKVPAALERRPEYPEEHTDTIRAFAILSRTRPKPTTPITLIEIEAYCRLFSITDTEFFVEIIAGLDQVFLTEMRKKITQAQDAAAKKRSK